MTATAAQIAQVRRMTAELTAATYSDDQLQRFIEAYPLLDMFGNAQYLETEREGIPDAPVINTEWIATYDLNAAAADIWAEKAGAVAANYDFATQGQSFNRNQQYLSYMQQSRYYRSRKAIGTIRQQPSPKPPDWLEGDHYTADMLDSDVSN